MRLSKQISGNAVERSDSGKQGRGEYEWCDLIPTDPPRDQLLDRRLYLKLAEDIVLDTGCVLTEQGGKNRLRIAEGVQATRHVYPHYHVAIALLLPHTTRQEQSWGAGLPILRNDEYSIVDLYFSSVELITHPDEGVLATVAQVTVQNQYGTEDIATTERMAAVQQVWASREQLGEELAGQLGAHHQLVCSGGLVSPGGAAYVASIQQQTAAISSELNCGYSTAATLDPLPALVHLLGGQNAAEIPLAEIPPELTEVRNRELHNRRLVVARSPSAVVFRRRVREAYNSTCVVCGLRLPACVSGGNPGVDSCHILP